MASLKYITAKLKYLFIIHDLAERCRINKLQFGFRENSSCAYAVATLKEIACTFKGKNKPVYACLLDYKQAFDTMNREIAFNNMRDKLHWRLWILFKRYYELASAAIFNNDETSEFFRIHNGTKQGGPASPTIFAIYMEPLIAEIQKENLTITIGDQKLGPLLYADDTILIADTHEKLKGMIKIVEKFCGDNLVRLNGAKSEYIIFNRTYTEYIPSSINGKKQSKEKLNK